MFILSGLPGSGKSTVARYLARKYRATYLRIDTIEQGIRDVCHYKVEGEGYELAYRMAADNLRVGNNVVADSCNPLSLTREAWKMVAHAENVCFINIEVICSDKKEHRTRVETRCSEVENLKLPTWEEVEQREYHPWSEDRIVIDTSHKTIVAVWAEVDEKLSALKAQGAFE